jgi:nitrogenase molybdenum-iron protein NifN
MRHPDAPELVPVSTPSYQGSHVQGFHAAVAALVAHFAEPMALERTVALFPGMVSPADLRHLREIVAGCGIEPILVPDYADTLDGPTLSAWTPLPAGGTTVADLRRLGGCRAGIQLGRCADPDPAAVLAAQAGTPASPSACRSACVPPMRWCSP